MSCRRAAQHVVQRATTGACRQWGAAPQASLRCLQMQGWGWPTRMDGPQGARADGAGGSGGHASQRGVSSCMGLLIRCSAAAIGQLLLSAVAARLALPCTPLARDTQAQVRLLQAPHHTDHPNAQACRLRVCASSQPSLCAASPLLNHSCTQSQAQLRPSAVAHIASRPSAALRHRRESNPGAAAAVVAAPAWRYSTCPDAHPSSVPTPALMERQAARQTGSPGDSHGGCCCCWQPRPLPGSSCRPPLFSTSGRGRRT